MNRLTRPLNSVSLRTKRGGHGRNVGKKTTTCLLSFTSDILLRYMSSTLLSVASKHSSVSFAWNSEILEAACFDKRIDDDPSAETDIVNQQNSCIPGLCHCLASKIVNSTRSILE
ncbi:hypothetical protein V6N13_046748 [Hibiscus sabdariffa]